LKAIHRIVLAAAVLFGSMAGSILTHANELDVLLRPGVYTGHATFPSSCTPTRAACEVDITLTATASDNGPVLVTLELTSTLGEDIFPGKYEVQLRVLNLPELGPNVIGLDYNPGNSGLHTLRVLLDGDGNPIGGEIVNMQGSNPGYVTWAPSVSAPVAATGS